MVIRERLSNGVEFVEILLSSIRDRATVCYVRDRGRESVQGWWRLTLRQWQARPGRGGRGTKRKGVHNAHHRSGH